MDICLNITAGPNPSTKSKPKTTTTKKPRKSNPTQNNKTNNFKWTKTKNKKSDSEVINETQYMNKILYTTPSRKAKKFEAKEKKSAQVTVDLTEDQSEKIPAKKQNVPVEDSDKFKRKSFPLFDTFSTVSKFVPKTDEDYGPGSEQIFSSCGTTFTDLNIHPHLSVNLERMDIKTLTSVQEKTIPLLMAGKNVFVRSQTGSGKTLAYAIPIVDALQSITPHITRKDGVQALIVVPTRELALQTYELFLKLVEPFRWIVPGQLCGGENRNSEKARLRKGISILIGTPGRLLDHVLHTQSLKLDKIRCLVLDEADRLLDMGFQKDVNRLIEAIDQALNNTYDPIALMKSVNKPKPEINTQSTNEEESTNKIPPLKNIHSKERQIILLSATLTGNVKDLAAFTMKDYIYIDPLHSDNKTDLNAAEDIQSREMTVPKSVEQQFVVTDVKTKLVVLSSFIVSKAQEKTCKMFVFMASRQMVEYHEALFKKCLVKRPKKEVNVSTMIAIDEDSDDSGDEEEEVLDIKFFKLHGSMEQRERVEIFKAFRNVTKGVLLCTDVAARGVDVPHADYVVQYNGPLQDDDYIHRVGRTGRAGKKGHAILFLTEPELEYTQHLKEKKLHLKRLNQNTILKHLEPFMEHVSPGSVQAAAEMLQRRFEKALASDKRLEKAACLAYSSWSRYYSSYPSALKPFFNFKNAHLGHYVTSFGLKSSPQEVGRFVRSEMGKTSDKRLNKKLANHETNKELQRVNPLKVKKRPRGKELLMSEYDSGLKPLKKKVKKN